MELQDKDTVQMISDILEKFDPKETIEEDEALFCARMGQFEKKADKKEGKGGRRRNKAIVRVSDSYHAELAVRERKEEAKRKEREERMARTKALQNNF